MPFMYFASISFSLNSQKEREAILKRGRELVAERFLPMASTGNKSFLYAGFVYHNLLNLKHHRL